ncbi:hypothetical protein EYR38_009136 [Pleurotus pulmonarius]|nr:hypothetical protein EYR38_009136 [Pleurotus pulmonarius]
MEGSGREETYPSGLARKLALAADGSLPPVAKVSSITATDRAATSTNSKATVAPIAPTGVLAARPSDIELRDLLLQLLRELSVPPHTCIAEGSKPRIVDRPCFRAAEGSEIKAITSTNSKTTVAIPPTGVLAARPPDIEIRDLLLQLLHELSAPLHTPIAEGSKPRMIDRPCFPAAEDSEINAITTALDHVALEPEGLSPVEKGEFEGIAQSLFDVPLLDLPSPTGSDFGLLTSTPAKVRDRLIHVHREHVRTSANEKGNETEILSDTEESQDIAAIDSIQGPALSMASGTKGIVISLAQPPKKRRDIHEKTDIAFNSGSIPKVAKEITTNDTTPPEKLAIANNEKASIKLLDEVALVDDESAGSIDPFVL